MTTMRVTPVKPINPDAKDRVRVLYNGTQTVVGTNGRYGAWLYVTDPKKVYA